MLNPLEENYGESKEQGYSLQKVSKCYVLTIWAAMGQTTIFLTVRPFAQIAMQSKQDRDNGASTGKQYNGEKNC